MRYLRNKEQIVKHHFFTQLTSYAFAYALFYEQNMVGRPDSPRLYQILNGQHVTVTRPIQKNLSRAGRRPHLHECT